MWFLTKWYGILAFVLFDVVALIAAIALTYKWFFKRALDILVSAVLIIALSPVFIVLHVRAVIYKKRGVIPAILQKETKIGKKGKAICLHTYRTTNEQSEETAYGTIVKKVGLYKLPYLLDVFLGKLSFIGPLSFSGVDTAFLDEEEQARLHVRPGLIHPLVESGSAETDFDEIVETECSYAQRVSLFKDVKLFFVWLLKKIRLEGKYYLGEANEKTYAKALLDDERITQEDFDAAVDAKGN